MFPPLSKMQIKVQFDLDMKCHIVHKCKVPYNDQGELTQDQDQFITLDLSQGQQVVTRDGREGQVIRYCPTQTSWELNIQVLTCSTVCPKKLTAS